MHDIISIGSAVRDIFVLSKEFESIETSRVNGGFATCLPRGGKIDVEDLYVTSGGGGTNSTATFSALGLRTGIITRLGKDEDGDAILHDLEKRKINTNLLIRDGSDATGLSILLTSPGGERTVLTYRGVSGQFTQKDILVSKMHTRAIYVSSTGGNFETLQKIARFARKNKIFFAWNPGNGELDLPRKQLREILDATTLLLVNKEEAERILGGKPEHLSTIGLTRALARHENQIIVVTDGTKGTHAVQGKEAWHVGTRDIKSISRTGAGDAFGSGTVAALLKGCSLLDALRIGTLNAESVIQSYGAKQGILTEFPPPSKLDEIPYKKL